MMVISKQVWLSRDKFEVVDLELAHEPVSWVEHIVVDLPGNNTLVGYLVLDHDCHNPLSDCDGMGTISEDRYDIRCVLGIDEYGCPDLEPYIEEATKRVRLSVRAKELICDPEEVDRRINEISEIDYETRIEKIATEMWENRTIDPFAISLRGYDNSNWRIEDNTDRVNAVWIADDCLREHLLTFPPDEQYKEALKVCQSTLDLYQEWADGDCYGIITEIFDKHGNVFADQDDAVWGYVGTDHAKRELKEFVENRKMFFKLPQEPEDPNQLLMELDDLQQLKLELK